MTTFSCDNDNGIEYDDNEIEDYDDKIDDNDEDHDENETKRLGAKLIKRSTGSTIDHTTVSATTLDVDLLPAPEQEEIEGRRGKKAEDDDEAELELPRAVAPKTAKQQFNEKLAAATAKFGKLPNSA